MTMSASIIVEIESKWWSLWMSDGVSLSKARTDFFRRRLEALLACQIRQPKDLDIPPQKVYSCFNSKTIQSSGQLSTQPYISRDGYKSEP
jgi:hypothetical protein